MPWFGLESPLILYMEPIPILALLALFWPDKDVAPWLPLHHFFGEAQRLGNLANLWELTCYISSSPITNTCSLKTRCLQYLISWLIVRKDKLLNFLAVIHGESPLWNDSRGATPLPSWLCPKVQLLGKNDVVLDGIGPKCYSLQGSHMGSKLMLVQY